MVDNSGFVAGGGIPEGDQIRTTGSTYLTGLTTILTESSGSGGVFYGIHFESTSSATHQIISVKVTIDGASERTLTYSNGSGAFSQSTTLNNFGYLPLPINYATSLTVKVDISGSSAYAIGVYSLKA